MKRRLTKEAKADQAEFDNLYGPDGNCSCHLSAPCGSCTHPGHPIAIAENDDAWEVVYPGRVKQIHRIKRNIRKLLTGYLGLKLTEETSKVAAEAIRHGRTYGWNRQARKRAKMALRGTYQPAHRWPMQQITMMLMAAYRAFLARNAQVGTATTAKLDPPMIEAAAAPEPAHG